MSQISDSDRLHALSVWATNTPRPNRQRKPEATSITPTSKPPLYSSSTEYSREFKHRGDIECWRSSVRYENKGLGPEGEDDEEGLDDGELENIDAAISAYISNCSPPAATQRVLEDAVEAVRGLRAEKMKMRERKERSDAWWGCVKLGFVIGVLVGVLAGYGVGIYVVVVGLQLAF